MSYENHVLLKMSTLGIAQEKNSPVFSLMKTAFLSNKIQMQNQIWRDVVFSRQEKKRKRQTDKMEQK